MQEEWIYVCIYDHMVCMSGNGRLIFDEAPHLIFTIWNVHYVTLDLYIYTYLSYFIVYFVCFLPSRNHIEHICSVVS